MAARRRPSGQGPSARRSKRPNRGSVRPGTTRRTSATGPESRSTPTPRIRPPRTRRMSARTAVLALVLSALALAYAYPVRTYFAQHAEIEQLRAQQADQRERISALEEERAKWEDPSYVITQARIHLLLVRPGEKPLIVIDDPAGAAEDAGGADGESTTTPGDTWYEKLWTSVDGADHAG